MSFRAVRLAPNQPPDQPPDPPPSAPPALTRAELERAAKKLRAHLVPAPLIGALALPGLSVPQELRIKPEVLQPSGSAWYRGALHWALARLGSAKGFVASGGPREACAFACVASAHRTPCVVVLPRELAGSVEPLLREDGAELLLVADEGHAEAECGRAVARTGFLRAGRPGAHDFDLGLATLALELEEGLPSDAAVHLGSPALLGPLRAGLAALGSGRRVALASASLAPGAAGSQRIEAVIAAVAQGVRLHIGASSALAILGAASDPGSGPRCAVLCE